MGQVDHLNTQNCDVGIPSSNGSVRGKGETDFQMGMGANATFFTQKVPSAAVVMYRPILFQIRGKGARGGTVMV